VLILAADRGLVSLEEEIEVLLEMATDGDAPTAGE